LKLRGYVTGKEILRDTRMKCQRKTLFCFLARISLLAIFVTDLAVFPRKVQAAEAIWLNYIDTHAHLDVRPRKGRVHPSDYERAAETALSTMDSVGIRKTLIMPPPLIPESGRRGEEKSLAEIVRKHPQRFAFLGGGGTLNPIIQEAVRAGQLRAETNHLFEQIAIGIIRNGAVGFGEVTAEHFSFRADHPYESAPPDHPLFLLLTDIAARYNVPIDLHMEAISQDTSMPDHLSSPRNPKNLRENISAFERLLSHNRNARIIWAHTGWDNTGDRTVALMRRLLLNHSNLYMSIKIDRLSLPENRPLTGGKIRPEGMELIRSFPDRFIIGGDEHYGIPGSTGRGLGRSKASRLFLDQLPDELAIKVAAENALRIYRLK
jgi:hypothetical protein